MFDMRSQNGRPNSTKFDQFWAELDRFLDEQSAVHERRRQMYMYMPFAISMEDLRQQIKALLPEVTPVPSISWMRLQFWPSNAYTKTAMSYTGKYQVKYKVQQRLARAQHADAKYAAHQFFLIKSAAVKFRDYALFVSMDDKAIVPVGEPDRPISSGVRAHNKSLAAVNTNLVALVHDFHICGVVPSVSFCIDIPQHPGDSFYQGNLHVSVKDKIFSPSIPLRHSTDLVSMIRMSDAYSNDGVNLNVPILYLYIDGGPDHRTTYWSVKVALVALFIALDLDFLVAGRTAPSQSYANPAERAMSLLNLGLQNITLTREKMDNSFEQKMKSLSSINLVQNASQRNPDVKEKLVASMEPVLSLLKERFKMTCLTSFISSQIQFLTKRESINHLKKYMVKIQMRKTDQH